MRFSCTHTLSHGAELACMQCPPRAPAASHTSGSEQADAPPCALLAATSGVGSSSSHAHPYAGPAMSNAPCSTPAPHTTPITAQAAGGIWHAQPLLHTGIAERPSVGCGPGPIALGHTQLVGAERGGYDTAAHAHNIADTHTTMRAQTHIHTRARPAIEHSQQWRWYVQGAATGSSLVLPAWTARHGPPVVLPQKPVIQTYRQCKV